MALFIHTQNEIDVDNVFKSIYTAIISNIQNL